MDGKSLEFVGCKEVSLAHCKVTCRNPGSDKAPYPTRNMKENYLDTLLILNFMKRHPRWVMNRRETRKIQNDSYPRVEVIIFIRLVEGVLLVVLSELCIISLRLEIIEDSERS